MTEIDLILRGGTVAIAAFLTLHLLRSRLAWDLRVSGSAFLVGCGAYSLVTAANGVFDISALLLLARLEPIAFWWFAMCLFDKRYPHWLVPVAALWLAVNPLVSGAFSNPLHQITVVVVLGHVIYVAITGLDEDLVAARRWLRIAVGAVLPLVGLIISYFELFPPPLSIEPALLLLQATSFVVIAVLFAVYLTRLNAMVLPPNPPGQAVPADTEDGAKLAQLLADGVHRTESLTIGALAAQMDIPEHRLRYLINTQMGYRNFSELVHDLRIDDAKTMLADPENRSKHISQIAYGVGYGSLAPFNRAFRKRTGQSPSDFRRDTLLI